MRFLKKRAKGPFKAAPAASGASYAYAVNRNEWSTAAGVVIDGVVYRLAGEPPTAPCGTSGFKGNGQR